MDLGWSSVTKTYYFMFKNISTEFNFYELHLRIEMQNKLVISFWTEDGTVTALTILKEKIII